MSHGPVAAVQLQHSESQILAAASRIYAAHVAAGSVEANSESAVLEHSIAIATRMALRIDRLLESDSEVSSLSRRGPA